MKANSENRKFTQEDEIPTGSERLCNVCLVYINILSMKNNLLFSKSFFLFCRRTNNNLLFSCVKYVLFAREETAGRFIDNQIIY